MDFDTIALEAAHEIEALPTDLPTSHRTARIQCIVLKVLDNATVVLKSDRENLHQRVKGLLGDNERLRQRVGDRGLEVVEISGAGHYVNAAVKAEIDALRLRDAAETIPAHLNWLIGKGKTRPTEPLYGVQLLDRASGELVAEAESDDLSEAIGIAITKAA